MINLTTKGINEFWDNYPDDEIKKIIYKMDSIEKWSQDSNENIPQKLEELSKKLSNITKQKIDTLINDDNFLYLLVNLKSSTSFRVMYYIDSISPGSASTLLSRAELSFSDISHPLSNFVLRNISFERMRIVHRVFGDKRSQMIKNLIESN